MVKFYCDRCEREFDPDFEEKAFNEELKPGDIRISGMWFMEKTKTEKQKQIAEDNHCRVIVGDPVNLCAHCRRELKAIIMNFVKPDEDKSMFCFTPSEGDAP